MQSKTLEGLFIKQKKLVPSSTPPFHSSVISFETTLCAEIHTDILQLKIKQKYFMGATSLFTLKPRRKIKFLENDR